MSLRARSTTRGAAATGNQINVFLYQVLPDAAWRNRDMPRQMRPGETGHPPLPLVLYYLLTAYSDDEDDTTPTAYSARR